VFVCESNADFIVLNPATILISSFKIDL
jgi:hypothetical protein